MEEFSPNPLNHREVICNACLIYFSEKVFKTADVMNIARTSSDENLVKMLRQISKGSPITLGCWFRNNNGKKFNTPLGPMILTGRPTTQGMKWRIIKEIKTEE